MGNICCRKDIVVKRSEERGNRSVIVQRGARLNMSILILFLFFFFSWYLHDRWADLHQIFQEDVKWAAIEKLSFRFLNSFEGGREVQKGLFRFGHNFAKCNTTVKRIYLSKKSCPILTGLFLHQPLKTAQKSVKWRPRSFGVFGVFSEHWGARLATLPSDRVSE